MSLENLSIIIVDPKSGRRGKLREVLRTFVYKGRVEHALTVRELEERLAEKDANIDIIFLAYAFGDEAITQLLAKLAGRESGESPPIIVTLDSHTTETTVSVAGLYMAGAAGFICEPYSTDQVGRLLEAIRGSAAKAADGLRLRRTAGLVVRDAADRLDALVKQQLEGLQPGGYALRELRLLSRTLQKFYQQDPDEYARAALSVFEKSQPLPPEKSKRRQKGAGAAVKHPGAVIKDIMRMRSLSLERLLEIVKIERPDLEQLLDEKVPIDERTAREIARALGKTSREWLKLQKEYDAYAAQKGAGSAS